jgi:hypothetical protein
MSKLRIAAFGAVLAAFLSPQSARSDLIIFEQISPNPTVYTLGIGSDWFPITFGAPGDVTAELQAVPPRCRLAVRGLLPQGPRAGGAPVVQRWPSAGGNGGRKTPRPGSQLVTRGVQTPYNSCSNSPFQLFQLP